MGGHFTRVDPLTGHSASLDPVGGVPRPGYPAVDGTVDAAAPDGLGGWYVGGSFKHVARVARSNLAHVRADGTLDGWDPGADNVVRALAVNGSTVYAGGAFAGGLARIYPAPASSPSVAVLSPNGSETLVAGSTHVLPWYATAAAPGVLSVDLYLSAAGAPNTGAWDWVVAAPAASGTCYWRVDARDCAGTVASDASNAGFSIVPLSAGEHVAVLDGARLRAGL